MSKRILRLSATGILTLSVVACGNDEIPQSQEESVTTTDTTHINPQDIQTCLDASKTQDLEKFLQDLRSQGRITDCKMLKIVDDGSVPTDIPDV